MASYLFPKYQVVNAGSPLTIAPYATATADPDERLWEKRAFFWNDGVTYPMMKCYFEVDEDSVTTLGLPPAGKRLKINDGTKTYRVITQMEYNRGIYSTNEPTKMKNYSNPLQGNSTEYKLDFEDNLPVGRRSYWYDTGSQSAFNYKNLVILVDAGSTITIKIELTYTNGDDSITTDIVEHSPDRFLYKVYPKPGSNVNIKIYHKGNVSSSLIILAWLQDY